MRDHLISLEREGLQLRSAGRIKEAAKLFETIVKEEPDWEHGTAFYTLACCYEDMDELVLAEENYCRALQHDAKNPIFLGGLASYLYLHGDPAKAFESYLALLRVEMANEDQRGKETTTTALRSLGKKMGLSEEAVEEKIKTITR